MSGLERALARWLTDRDLMDLSDGEVLAVVDALALAIYADFSVNRFEDDAFESLVTALTWGRGGEDGPLDRPVEVARMRAGAVTTPEALDAFAANVAGRLPASALEKVYSMIVTIAVADNEIKSEEEDLLSSFAGAFGIKAERAEAIYRATLRALNKIEG